MSHDTTAWVTEPRPGHALDASKLLAFLRTAPGFPARTAQLGLKQFGHGQSNPTFLVEALGEAAAPGQAPPLLARFVLRKQPPGKLLRSAHDVEREFTVLSALSRHGSVPVPAPLAFCKDPSVVGTPFYVMQHVAGRIFLDQALPDMRPGERREAYGEMARALAALHSFRPAEVGLGGFGKGENYAARQVETWARQYAASSPTIPVDHIVSFLRANAPKGPTEVSVVHGDYRLDNLVFDYKSTRILAVLDWELSTLGDPLSDLAYLCMPYHFASSPGGRAGFPSFHGGVVPEGVPSERELRALYFRHRGRPDPYAERGEGGGGGVAPWGFYLALSMFRMAAILQGVAARAAAGNASSTDAAKVGDLAGVFIAKAEEVAGLSRAAHASGPSGSAGSPSSRATGSSGGAPGGGGGGFTPSARVAPLLARVRRFVDERVLPMERDLVAHSVSADRWSVCPVVERLKAEAKAEGLWNLWLPVDSAALLKVPVREGLLGPGLTNEEYAHLAEVMGECPWASEAFNCSAPDTGNMEVLLRYGTAGQQARWLVPLLEGEIRSCFAMTEPEVASSDAKNICARVERRGGDLVLSGRKWWTSGACDPRCKLAIFMGKSGEPGAPAHRQQSMVLVPMDAPGVTVVRPLPVYGYEDAPHGHAEVLFENVVVPHDEAMLLGAGRGFEIAQGRLGPGRLHHCMRLLGAGRRGLDLACARARERTVFGKTLDKQGGFVQSLGRASLALEQARLATLSAAAALDAHGNKVAATQIAMAKVAAPAAALHCLDFAVQVHGGAGVSADYPLAYLWAAARTLRIADGPDEVHLQTIAKAELRRRRARL